MFRLIRNSSLPSTHHYVKNFSGFGQLAPPSLNFATASFFSPKRLHSSLSKSTITDMTQRDAKEDAQQMKPLEEKCFAFFGHQLLLTQAMELPKLHDPLLKDCAFSRSFSFVHNGVRHQAAELSTLKAAPSTMQLRDLVELYLHFPMQVIEPAGRARQLLEWNKAHQFCGECGSKTQPGVDAFSLMCSDSACQRIFFPRISPVVIVAIERGEEILMARSPKFPPEIFGLIAGFVEAGETLEQAVKREVMEEVGVEIENLRYFASQPWPRPNELVLAFQADYKSGKIVCDPKENESADFFHFTKLPKTFPGNVSILKWLLNDFCQRQEQKMALRNSGSNPATVNEVPEATPLHRKGMK